MTKGIFTTELDQDLISKAAKRGLLVTQGNEPRIAYEQTLIAGHGVDVPWDLLDSGFQFLERWDVAAPLWRYGVLAKDVGTTDERKRTEAVTLDLRIPLYAPELLFIRQSEAAGQFLECWRQECEGGANERLAFLRALCMVKPLFLALPRSWLKEGTGRAEVPRRPVGGMTKLVNVEIAPNRYVCCRPEEAEMYRQRFAEQRGGRRC